jgi:hypothetical protein
MSPNDPPFHCGFIGEKTIKKHFGFRQPQNFISQNKFLLGPFNVRKLTNFQHGILLIACYSANDYENLAGS